MLTYESKYKIKHKYKLFLNSDSLNNFDDAPTLIGFLNCEGVVLLSSKINYLVKAVQDVGHDWNERVPDVGSWTMPYIGHNNMA